MAELASIKKKLQKHGQSHLLQFFDELTPPGKTKLLEQIESLDLVQIDELIETYVRNKPQTRPAGEIAPPKVLPAKPADEQTVLLYKLAREKGLELLKKGQVAAFVVAGGQGTRLGYEGPKGCLEATPVAKKPLFQVFAEQISAAGKKAGKPIPWYIMTSPANDVVTRAFFRQNKYFGLNEKDVFFFVQGSMPAIGFDGKILLEAKDAIALSPNGHGGSLLAMRKSGALDEMKKRGVEYISYFQVDNPLVKCLDPLFLGLHVLKQADMSAKGLPKRNPLEKLGNFCMVDGKVTVIEYSDMPQDLAEATMPDGRLKFGTGSIAIHIISRQFAEDLTSGGKCGLPFHRAEKKVATVDDAGNPVKPVQPNAVKLEMFVFDALPLAREVVILETVRSEEFSPIKNATGEDSLPTALHDQIRRAAVWLEAAGVKVPRDADGQITAAIEISPLFADSPEDLRQKLPPNFEITAGQNVYLGERGQVGGAR